MSNQDVVGTLHNAQEAINLALVAAVTGLTAAENALMDIRESMQSAQSLVGVVNQGAESARLSAALNRISVAIQDYDMGWAAMNSQYRKASAQGREARELIGEHVEAILG